MPNKYDEVAKDIAQAFAQNTISTEVLEFDELEKQISKAIQKAVNEALDRQIEVDAKFCETTIGYKDAVAKAIRNQKREV